MTFDVINTPNAPAAIGPYVQALSTGQILYTSGQIPLVPGEGEITGDITVQTTQVFMNLKAVIEEAGATLDNVIKTTVFVTDLADFATVNGIYASFFGDHKPARSTVQVAALPLGANVEIEAIVVLG
ncbi:RidA family protein [Terasakiella sp. A23]|uniref:RidA family protein n=1 Tax=Terasakiella sp. FCG-A23 TaxID=3080561 RepID=UPI002952AD9A|nr:RidA family protein [Terasakiella sp. A23]MDV7341480.1 RidA family protein [Terasakiella sp. A23]